MTKRETVTITGDLRLLHAVLSLEARARWMAAASMLGGPVMGRQEMEEAALALQAMADQVRIALE